MIGLLHLHLRYICRQSSDITSPEQRVSRVVSDDVAAGGCHTMPSVAYLEFGKGVAWRVRGARAYNGGLGAKPPAGTRGRAPGRGLEGKAALKLKHFLLLNVQWKPQIRPFFLKFGNAKDHQTLLNFAILAGKWQKRTFSYKVACKKF